MTYHAKVIAGGKIVIPAEFRRELGIVDGDSLVVERHATGGLHIRTYAQVARTCSEDSAPCCRLIMKAIWSMN